MGRILTLKGVVLAGDVDMIFMFDSFVTNKGWRILSYDGMNMNDTTPRYDTNAYLHSEAKESIAVGTDIFEWDSNQVIGYSKNTQTGNINRLLDINHVVVSNLSITNHGADAFGYLIILEEMEITAVENILYLTKERAQS